MIQEAVFIGRLLCGVAGACLLYSSLFLYESEEGRFENVLEGWWSRVRILHGRALSLGTAFLKVVAEVTSRGLDSLFGGRLFAARAITASMCYSVAALLGYSLLLHRTLFIYRPESQNYVEYLLQSSRGGIVVTALFAAFFAVGSLGPWIRRRSSQIVWLIAAIFMAVSLPALCVVFFNRDHNWLFVSGFSLALAIALPAAIMCNTVFVAFARAGLRRAAAADSFVKISVLAIASAVAAYLLFVIAQRGLLWTGVFYIRHNNPLIIYRVVILETSYLLLAAVNFVGVLISLAWLFVVTVMLLQCLVWPILERPIYALHRYRVFTKQKKLVFSAGVALVGVAVPWVGHALGKLL